MSNEDIKRMVGLLKETQTNPGSKKELLLHLRLPA